MHNLNDMVIFARVVQSNGFSAAARTLNLPKSNISRRVARLEEALGVRLLERSTRTLHLTEIGRLYYRHCLRIIEESEQAEYSIHRLLEQPRGTLRISTSVTAGQQLLAPFLSEFLTRYPQLSLHLDLSNRRIDVINEGFDAALRIGPLEDSGLISRCLGYSGLYLYASNRYLDTFPEITQPSDLDKHTLLIMSDFEERNRITVYSAGSAYHVMGKQQIRINDFQSLLQLATDSMGIAVLPHYMCEASSTSRHSPNHQARPQLQRVLSAWSMQSSEFHIVFPSHRGATPKLRVFIDFVLEKLATLLYREKPNR